MVLADLRVHGTGVDRTGCCEPTQKHERVHAPRGRGAFVRPSVFSRGDDRSMSLILATRARSIAHRTGGVTVAPGMRCIIMSIMDCIMSMRCSIAFWR